MTPASATRAAAEESRSSAAAPFSMALIGVRSSWLTMAIKADLAAVWASAARRAARSASMARRDHRNTMASVRVNRPTPARKKGVTGSAVSPATGRTRSR